MKKIITAVGLAGALARSLACGHQAPPDQQESASVAGHKHRAPHGGVLVELGEEFAQVELLFDPDAGSLTAYVLDGDAEESVRLKQESLTVVFVDGGSPQQLALHARADILTGETVGDSSEFSATAPSLVHRTSLKGRILEIAVKGQVFRDVPF